MLNLVDGRHLVQVHAKVLVDILNHIVQDLGLRVGHTHPTCTANVPPSLRLEILRHNRRENDHFCVEIIQHLAVAQVQTVRNVLGQPDKVLVRVKQAQRVRGVVLVNLGVPLHGTRQVGIVALPVGASFRVVSVLGALNRGNGQNGLQGLADADNRNGLDEGLAQTAHKGLAGLGRGIGGLGHEVGIEMCGSLGVRTGDHAGNDDNVPTVLGAQDRGLQGFFGAAEDVDESRRDLGHGRCRGGRGCYPKVS